MKSSFSADQREFSEQENLSRLSSGAVLLAQDTLQDPNFDTTLVLICIHNQDGAYGLVLNRPAHMPLSEIFDGFTGLNLNREVFIGGPVQQEELQVLQITDTPVESAFQVAQRVFLGGKWESVGHMVETDPATTHLFLGYSGWAPGQLETEIKAGAWNVYKVNLEKLLVDPHRTSFGDIDSIASFLRTI